MKLPLSPNGVKGKVVHRSASIGAKQRENTPQNAVDRQVSPSSNVGLDPSAQGSGGAASYVVASGPGAASEAPPLIFPQAAESKAISASTPTRVRIVDSCCLALRRGRNTPGEHTVGGTDGDSPRHPLAAQILQTHGRWLVLRLHSRRPCCPGGSCLPRCAPGS